MCGRAAVMVLFKFVYSCSFAAASRRKTAPQNSELATAGGTLCIAGIIELIVAPSNERDWIIAPADPSCVVPFSASLARFAAQKVNWDYSESKFEFDWSSRFRHNQLLVSTPHPTGQTGMSEAGYGAARLASKVA